MKLGIDKVQKYGLESLVILFSIILSFYIEGQRDLANKKADKNKLIEDLINTIDEDLEQLEIISGLTSDAVKSFNDVQNDINLGNFNVSKNEIMSKIISSSVATSFFPQKGIFNQLIATGSFELIDSNELKTLLLRLFNHQNERNLAISNQIDIFQIEFQNKIYGEFRIDIEYNSLEGKIYGEQNLKSFTFNRNYYSSNEFYGLLSRAKQWGNMYIRLLDDIRENYKQARIYAEYEINN